MARSRKPYAVGRGKPPVAGRFKRGLSGNPKGRPKGSKNFSTVIEAELNSKVPISEGGRARKLSKRQVIAKQLVNRAAGGDPKATQTLINHDTKRQETPQTGATLEIFDHEQDRLVIADIVRRIRAAAPASLDLSEKKSSQEATGNE